MFGNSTLKLGNFVGIPVYAHWSTLILAAIIGFYIYPQYGQVSHSFEWRIVENLVVALVFIGAIFVHEAAHALMARSRNISVHHITLFAFGAGAFLAHDARRPMDEFLTTVVGPLSSLVLAGAFFAARHFAAGSSVDMLVVPFHALAWMNLSVGIFNLLPAFPIDGGRILRSCLWGVLGSFRRATTAAVYVSFVFLGLLAAYGVFMILSGYLFGGLWALMIAYFMYEAAKASLPR